jgi:hypothetical protein
MKLRKNLNTIKSLFNHLIAAALPLNEGKIRQGKEYCMQRKKPAFGFCLSSAAPQHATQQKIYSRPSVF